ncbi:MULTISPECIES: hotdog fold domain-containing protein [unclassified Chryseobacterium]|uniref:hotdog fold domain-containing protein n=1 Tax=unclassified Chryseobacterium TaxID=2593645 RepID=UPI000F4DE1A7|nr:MULTISPECIES: hotdog fold domain-containing protein [unclassified Chryseobacterium]
MQQSLITNEAVIHHALRVEGSNHIVVGSHFTFRKPVLEGDRICYRLKVASVKRGMVEREVKLLVGDQEKGR